MPPLRYSDRKRLAETGTLGDLGHDRVPDELATAVRVIVEGADARTTKLFEERLNRELMEHFGVGARWFVFFSGGDDADAFLDAVEILVEEAKKPVSVSRFGSGGSQSDSLIPIGDVEDRVNRAFERFRFGYRVENGEIRKIGSPALDELVVGPALLAVQRPGWEEAERSFREAVKHQRSNERDDALTAANAAVEAALKAIGLRGNTLRDLTSEFKKAKIVPGYLENVPDLLEDLLDRLHAARSTAGDAHGKPPEAQEVAAELADLAIYWAGAFIAYLADATS